MIKSEKRMIPQLNEATRFEQNGERKTKEERQGTRQHP